MSRNRIATGVARQAACAAAVAMVAACGGEDVASRVNATPSSPGSYALELQAGVDLPLPMTADGVDDGLRALVFDHWSDAIATYRGRLGEVQRRRSPTLALRAALGAAELGRALVAARAARLAAAIIAEAEDRTGASQAAHHPETLAAVERIVQESFAAARDTLEPLAPALAAEGGDAETAGLLRALSELARAGAAPAAGRREEAAAALRRLDQALPDLHSAATAARLVACHIAALGAVPDRQARCRQAWDALGKLSAAGAFDEQPLCRRAQALLGALLDAELDEERSARPKPPMLPEETRFCAPFDLGQPTWEGAHPLLLLAFAHRHFAGKSCQALLQAAPFLDALDRPELNELFSPSLRSLFNRVYADCGRGIEPPVQG